MQAKPFLRWAGSKRKQVPVLRTYWQETAYARYIEPFAGSSCLFFDLKPPAAILSDTNADLIRVYKVVRDSPEAVYERLSAIPRTRDDYYRIRSERPPRDAVGRAARFIYLNRNCFNGIYRTNAAGAFNVPYAIRPGSYPSHADFSLCARLLKNATLYAHDFGHTLRLAGEGDFVYLDPPYVVASRRVFREYGQRTFCSSDLERLSVHLSKLHSRRAHFLVSYADCVEARAIARMWRSRRIRVRRHIAGFAEARRSGYELLITNIQPEPQ